MGWRSYSPQIGEKHAPAQVIPAPRHVVEFFEIVFD